MRNITAKYRGKCASCGKEIAVGDSIMWTGGGSTYHLACATAASDGAGVEDEALGQQGLHELGVYDEPEDWESAQARRDEQEYQQGYHEVRAIQAMSSAGSALREQMYLEMEQAAYNRGED